MTGNHMSTCLFSLKCAPERYKPVYSIPKNVQLLTLILRKRINEIGKMVKRQGWLRYRCGFAAFMDLILIKLSLGHQSKSALFKWAPLIVWKKKWNRYANTSQTENCLEIDRDTDRGFVIRVRRNSRKRHHTQPQPNSYNLFAI